VLRCVFNYTAGGTSCEVVGAELPQEVGPRQMAPGQAVTSELKKLAGLLPMAPNAGISSQNHAESPPEVAAHREGHRQETENLQDARAPSMRAASGSSVPGRPPSLLQGCFLRAPQD
jgi:hypothetical protein